MRYRAFKRVSDGAWLSALITTTKPELRVKPEEHAAQVAPGFGLTAADVIVVDSDADPRVAPLVMPRLSGGASEALAATLTKDVEDVAQANGVNLPQRFKDAIAQRVRDRLRGAL